MPLIEDLSNNIAVIAQVQSILSKAISYPGELDDYKMDVITGHGIIPDQPATVIVYKTEQGGIREIFTTTTTPSKMSTIFQAMPEQVSCAKQKKKYW